MRRKQGIWRNAVILQELAVLEGWCACNALNPGLLMYNN